MGPRALAIAAVLALAAQAAVAGEAEESVLRQLFGDQPVTAEMFAPAFLQQVPEAQIQSIMQQLRAQVGAPVEVIEEADGSYTVRTPGYRVPVQIALDASGKVAGFFVRPPVPTSLTLDEIAAQMRGLGGDVALLVTRDGETLVAERADDPLAVGSAFKLGVLAAAADRVAASGGGWEQVVRLDASEISLPSGVLQVLRPGSPVTLDTLASLMIAISDNTAADALLDYAGRDAVAKKLGLDFALKTREVFALKGNAELRARYLAADPAGRQAVAGEIATMPAPSVADASALHVPGIEWDVPLTRLCALITEVDGLPYVHLSPGPVGPGAWQSVAYKGGSEPGVLNLTARVTDATGHAYCVAFTWNADAEVDPSRAGALYGAVFDRLASR